MAVGLWRDFNTHGPPFWQGTRMSLLLPCQWILPGHGRCCLFWSNLSHHRCLFTISASWWDLYLSTNQHILNTSICTYLCHRCLWILSRKVLCCLRVGTKEEESLGWYYKNEYPAHPCHRPGRRIGDCLAECKLSFCNCEPSRYDSRLRPQWLGIFLNGFNSYVLEEDVTDIEDNTPSESFPDVATANENEAINVGKRTRKTGQGNEFRIQVSAKHMTFASPFFKKALTGGWKKTKAYLEKGFVEITTEDWDLKALLIVLRAIHCQHNIMPVKVSRYSPRSLL